MSEILAELGAISNAGREFVAEFFFAPLGVEASPVLTDCTILGLIAVGGLLIYRIMSPAPKVRNPRRARYDFGRNV